MSELLDATAAINELVAAYGLTRDELADLMGGTVDGGPAGDGDYPITLPNGSVILAPCPRKIALLSGDVTEATAALTPIAAAAAGSAGLAGRLANDNVDADVAGAAAGSRGARWWNTLAQQAKATAEAARVAVLPITADLAFGVNSAVRKTADALPAIKTAADHIAEISAAPAAAAFVSNLYSQFTDPTRLKVEKVGADIIREVKTDGTHRAVLPFTYDSIVGQTVTNIPGIAKAWVALNGDVLGYRRTTGQIVDLMASVSAGATATSLAYADGTRYAVQRNAMASQWVYPLAIETIDGDLVTSTVARADFDGPLFAPLWISASRNFDPASRVLLGRVQQSAQGFTDDHNEAAIAHTPRPGAANPWQAIQADHSQRNYSRSWISNDPLGPYTARPNIGSSSNKTYGQVFIKPDNDAVRWLLFRNAGGSEEGQWSVYVSIDSGATCATQATMFGSPGLYIGGRPTFAGDGIWLFMYGHPTNASDHKIRVAKLKWTGELVVPNGAGGETQVRANLFDGGAAFNPMTQASPAFPVLLDPGANNQRLFDHSIWDFGDELHVTGAQFARDTADTQDGYYVRAVLTLATGVVTTSQVTACGGKIDPRANLTSGSSYIAGCCIVSKTAMVCARYFPIEGYSDVVLMRFSGGEWKIAATLDRVTGGKLARPHLAIRTVWDATAGKIVFSLSTRLRWFRMEGPDGGYTDFYSFISDAIDFDLRKLGNL